MQDTIGSSCARLATLDQLIETTIPAFLAPVPSKDTLRSWFDDARIPRFKSNPMAKRGGGRVFYQVSGVEKFLRGRTTHKIERLQVAA
jgi:trehalose utilization protein